MSELIILAGLNKTTVLYFNKNTLKAVYEFNEFLDASFLPKLPSADKTVIYADDTVSNCFVYQKSEIKKNAIFADIALKMDTTDVVYAIEEVANFFIIGAIRRDFYSRILAFRPDSVSQLELNIARNSFLKYKKPVILKGRRLIYQFSDETIRVVDAPDKLFAYANSITMSSSPYSFDEDVKGIRGFIKGNIARPWLTVRVAVDRSVNLPEWAYISEFTDPDFLNMQKETFVAEKEKSIPPDMRRLIKALAIILSSFIITFGTSFIKFSLPFERIAPLPIPSDVTISTTAELQKFVYNKGSSYTLYRIILNGQDKGYFTNKDEALKFATSIKGMEVYAVEYKDGNEVGRTKID